MRGLITSLCIILPVSVQADATVCDGFQTARSSATFLEPGSVPADELAAYMNASPYTHGLKFDISLHEGDLRIDIVEAPGDSQRVAGLMAILQIGRLVEDEFRRVVLVDQGTAHFGIDGSVVRSAGCRTLWGVSTEGTVVPMLVDVMRSVYDSSGDRVTPPPVNAWLTDMNAALGAFNEVVAPAWMFSAVR